MSELGEPIFPALQRDPSSAEFFDAAARGELLIQRCAADGLWFGPEVKTSSASGSVDFENVPASGRAALVSWVVVHQVPSPVLAAAVPYVSAVVELEEGPWIMVRLIDVDGAELRAGMPVVARFVPSGTEETPGETMPVFAPA